jgi:2-hydroxy-6-oxonona-2,4-dienedioate hydrolase
MNQQKRKIMEPHLSIWGDFAGVELRQHFVNAAGIRTRIVEAGSGPTLVMVHGTGGHLEAYTRNVRELSQHFRLVLFDMVGHGLSEKPNRPYLIDYLSDHLVAVLDVLGIERAHLSGESLGGWVAAWTAAHHPDRVDRLV